jgi:hypothetical protein
MNDTPAPPPLGKSAWQSMERRYKRWLEKIKEPKALRRGPICSHTQEANVLSHISGDLMIHSGGRSVTKPFV